MSRKATEWAWGADLPLCAKMILLVYADHAGEDGQAVWSTTRTLKRAVTQTTDATISKHVGILLTEGFIREGDQDRISPYWKTRPPKSRPLVYDLAMDDETRLAWKTAHDPAAGRRGAATAAGRAGGTRSAELRQPATPQDSGGKDSEPTPGSRISTQGVGQEFEVKGVKNLDPRTKSFKPVNPGGGGDAPTPSLEPDLSPPASAPAPTSNPDVNEVVRQVQVIRPGWNVLEVLQALGHPAARAAPFDRVRELMLILAADPATERPGRLGVLLPRYLKGGNLTAARTEPEPARSAAAPLPPDWQPTSSLLGACARNHPGVDVHAEAEKFRLHYWSTGAVRQNWSAAFQKWVADQEGFQARRTRQAQAAATRPATSDVRFDQIEELRREMLGPPGGPPGEPVPATASVITLHPEWLDDLRSAGPS